MPHAPRPTRRPAFTLVELLVVMAVIIVLSSIALMVVPNAVSQDRTTDAAATVRQQLTIAKARATRDNKVYGIRFIGPTNAKQATELQFVEQPDPLVPNPNALTTGAYVEFEYGLDTTNNQIAARKCYLMNLPTDAYNTINNDLSMRPLLVLPVLGVGRMDPTQFEITAITAAGGTHVGAANWEVTLAATPNADNQIGAGGLTANPTPASGTLRVYQFGIKPGAVPLLGEPTVQLPKNTCVDLASSYPNSTDTAQILFAPNGQVRGATAAQYFLWIRDYTMNGGDPAKNPSPLGDYPKGGEQQVIAVKTTSGALGVFPIAWPPDDPFKFAKLAASAP